MHGGSRKGGEYLSGMLGTKWLPNLLSNLLNG